VLASRKQESLFGPEAALLRGGAHSCTELLTGERQIALDACFLMRCNVAAVVRFVSPVGKPMERTQTVFRPLLTSQHILNRRLSREKIASENDTKTRVAFLGAPIAPLRLGPAFVHLVLLPVFVGH